MHTSLEFIGLIKGVEYLIAIALVISFVVFWQLGYGKRRMLTVAPLMLVVAAIVVLVGNRISSAPEAALTSEGASAATSSQESKAPPVFGNTSSRVR